jgi:hypothetical protein
MLPPKCNHCSLCAPAAHRDALPEVFQASANSSVVFSQAHRFAARALPAAAAQQPRENNANTTANPMRFVSIPNNTTGEAKCVHKRGVSFLLASQSTKSKLRQVGTHAVS